MTRLAWALIALPLACSAQSPDPAERSQAPACELYCEALWSADCAQPAPADCLTLCEEKQQALAASACGREASAAFECAAQHLTAQCWADGEPYVKDETQSCQVVNTAWDLCMQAAVL